ncbi:glycine betaine/L-proline ABC transporter ATP-binding protein [Curvibacter sp. CHRR-16]|uniref:quaternary amine ABC transporter ATP-binding protein n=1 Tax=Curvibacter sp. CHRR-16 TaxID=2835872 RepID=UPI001BDA3AE9|nr:glycine betaine/L-proline ABC transporter ATP-binding protein [Curvibacter sp. CHRR-16]MBT0570704.1 glycine betaine/L-proline ABC transporter ATP-binding protein [Curvibacter sp. CHRR-16]
MRDLKIQVRNLYKIFGGRSEEALKLLSEGWDKNKIFEKTGQVVGVNNVGFDVRSGEIFVLMGLSGSGKSTLIRLINRLVEPDAGEILIDGDDLTKLSQSSLVKWRRQKVAMVFQSFALMPHKTVLENAAFGLEVAGMQKAHRERKAMHALEQVGLKDYARKYPHQLSGGMQQRVGLARALAVDPDILLMDEAFSALDPLKRTEMQDLMLELQRVQRRTILFVSHDLEEALRIGTSIAIMEGGNLVQVGTPRDIVANPVNDYVRRFFHGVDTSRYLTAGDLLDQDEVDPSSWEQVLKISSHSSLTETLGQIMVGSGRPIGVLDDANQVMGCITAKSVLSKMVQGARHV